MGSSQPSHRRGCCETCGYDVSGNLELGACPECGERFDLRRPTRRPLLRETLFGKMLAAIGIGCPVVLSAGSVLYRRRVLAPLGPPRSAVALLLALSFFTAFTTLVIVCVWVSLIPHSERPHVGWIAGLLLTGLAVGSVLLATQ